MDYLNLITQLGFPIASSIAAGYFVYLTLKFILATVNSSVKNLSDIIKSLDHRVKTMTHDVIKIDILMSSVLGVKPDVDRISRLNSNEDVRKD